VTSSVNEVQALTSHIDRKSPKVEKLEMWGEYVSKKNIRIGEKINGAGSLLYGRVSSVPLSLASALP
jgi:hypothetical protein